MIISLLFEPPGNCRLVSQDPPKAEDDPCADVAEAIGQKILQSGTTLAGIFRSWDQDMGESGLATTVRDMGVSINGGTPWLSSILTIGFSRSQKPSSYWGYPHGYGFTPQGWVMGWVMSHAGQVGLPFTCGAERRSADPVFVSQLQ